MQKGLYILDDFMSASLNGFNGILIEKILKLSTPAKKYFDTGKIMNFITIDQQMVFYMCMVLAYVKKKIK